MEKGHNSRHSPCADDFIVKKYYLPLSYVKRPDAAGLHSSDMMDRKRSYIATGHRSSVQDTLGYNPVEPTRSRHNLPIYEAQFYTGTEINRGPKQESVRSIPDYPHKKDQVSVVIDDRSIYQNKDALQSRIARNEHALREHDHPTRQTTDKPLSLETEYYNPSIRSHNCFKMRGVDDASNYRAQVQHVADQMVDRESVERRREFIRNTERMYDD